ncbi:hypothetical protein GRX03_00840 [Halovenus sp. WSH3]|uniref:Bacterial Ig-like domain-containing protein n=1 Tax=Halovenus carboxidivorans TaxID=2692199 RepID=A0A6B0T1Q3_9EURY|nr:immunoglobulin-like domain-containing protein [Halovenus carboxidivorans]MXR50156.1 hypothetical protein [Halovenus carboxidivorans]
MARTRRDLLAALAGGGVVLAGCVGDGSSTDSGDETDTTSPDSAAGAPASLPEDSYPGDCPAYETARVICYDPVAGSDDTPAVENVPAVLEPSTRSLSGGESIEFVLSNQSDVPLSTNFYNWRLDKRVDGEWYHVAPLAVNQPLMSIPPGERHTWSVTIDNSAVEGGETLPRASGTDDLTLAGIGGGRYAFRARGWFGDDHETDIAFAATFAYEADPVELTTTPRIDRTEFDGDTLVAEAGDANRTYLLESAPSGGERRITEQLLRSPPHRDAVALARRHDADRVRLDGYDTPAPLRDGLGRFRYDGDHYELTTQGDDCGCRQ